MKNSSKSIITVNEKSKAPSELWKSSLFSACLKWFIFTVLLISIANVNLFACSKPTSSPTLTLSCNGSTSIDVSWAQVTADGYVVFRSTSILAPTITDGTTYVVGNTYLTNYVCVYNGNSTSFSSTGLTANTSYNYYLFSYNSVGTGTCPAYINNSSSAALKTAPSTAAPTLTVYPYSSLHSSEIVLSWTNPTAGRSAGFDYDLSTNNFTTSVNGYPKFVSASASNPQTINILSLQNTNTYYARVRYSSAQNNGCGGAWSNIISFVLVCCNPPGGPQSISNVVPSGNGFSGNVVLTTTTHTGVIVFADPNNNIPPVVDGTSYNPGDVLGSAIVIFTGGGSGTNIPFTTQAPASLSPNTTYYLSAFSYMTGSPCSIAYSGTWITGQQYNTSGTVGMNNFDLQNNGFTIYPNPAGNQLTVYGLQFAGKSTLNIYNVVSEKMISSTLSFGDGRGEGIDISSLSRGIYFLRVISGSTCLTKTFIKQ